MGEEDGDDDHDDDYEEETAKKSTGNNISLTQCTFLSFAFIIQQEDYYSCNKHEHNINKKTFFPCVFVLCVCVHATPFAIAIFITFFYLSQLLR